MNVIILKKILSKILSRNAATVLLLLLQIGFIILSVTALGEKYYIIYFILIILDIVLVIFITNKISLSRISTYLVFKIAFTITWFVSIIGRSFGFFSFKIFTTLFISSTFLIMLY